MLAQAVEQVEELDELLAVLRAASARVAAMPLRDLDGPQAAAARRVLRVVGDQVQLASATLLAAVEQDGRWATGGADRTAAGWASRREGIAYGEASRELRVGRAIEDLPGARAAIVSGEITRGHLDALAEVTTSEARRAALASGLPDRNEAFLLAQARRLGVDEFRKVTKGWAIAVDGPAAERDHTDAVVRESLAFSRRRDGLAVTGFLTHENGEVLTTAVRAVAGVPAKDDDRSIEQRQAAALAGVARLVLDKGLSGKGAQIRPHLSVHVSFESLERLAAEAAEREAAREAALEAGDSLGGSRSDGVSTGRPAAGADASTGRTAAAADASVALVAPAQLDSGEPLPRSVLERIACDSAVTRIVFGPEGHVLDVGRAERTYTKQLRRAVIARDRSCQYPGCAAPPNLGEVHHIRWWDRGGPTSVANGILLCWYHHGEVHRRDLRIEAVNHGFRFAYRDGRPVAPPGRDGPDPHPVDAGERVA
ncbi:DUF222 domain-containing protein [Actinotalea ferrariae]|uniref:HNH endonuclease signature motif containing protein n=1 Tax=Actinotalea ferrariae TaxID=1386098 RepID=UPI001C8B1F44|nr:HNH endonuclease signature motif containing protein [Actinotalea ferrariae]MBX9245960.1 DUF222 domain-containing protein [Actinotalea ferrariae]